MLETILESIQHFWPEITLALTFVVAMVVEFSFKGRGRAVGIVVLAGLILAAIQLPFAADQSRLIFSGMIAVDPFSAFFKYVILATASVIIVFSLYSDELQQENASIGEFFTLLAAMTFGMMLMAGATNLLMIYLSIEMVSISSYILAGFSKSVKRSSEAALKYVLFGGTASAVMLYGISIFYGLTGSLDIHTIQATLASGVIQSPGSYAALMLAIMMLLVGFGYKISAVPFHYWTPDVYEGAPVTITAFLSVASKAAGFAVMIRFFYVTFYDTLGDIGHWVSLPNIEWSIIIVALSVLTMTLGNLVAIWQDNLKRMLAYSSIAHAGYILMGLVVMSDVGLSSMLLYIAIYFFMNLGAFFVVMAVADKLGSEDIDDYRGLGARAPVMAATFTIFLVSLIGLPPLAGFIGKWYLFTAVLEFNSGEFWWLALIAVVNSAISLYYYARVFRNMYLREPMDGDKSAISFSPVITGIAVLFAIPNLFLIFDFSSLVEFAEYSVQIFLH